MIALNKLLENLEEYEKTYNVMGLKINLSPFVELEEKLKTVQLELEGKKALCNKLCAELIKKNVAGQNTTDEFKEIKSLESEISKLQTKFDNVSSSINTKLKTLPNIPDKRNTSHLQIETSKTECNLNDLKLEIEKFCSVESSILTKTEFVKAQAGKQFLEENLPTATYLQKGIVVLCTEDQVDALTDKFINYFKSNSLSMIERSITKIKKSSTREFFIHLKSQMYLKFEIKREYFSRKYKFKYRDKKTDMTKFVNQINLIF